MARGTVPKQNSNRVNNYRNTPSGQEFGLPQKVSGAGTCMAEPFYIKLLRVLQKIITTLPRFWHGNCNNKET